MMRSCFQLFKETTSFQQIRDKKLMHHQALQLVKCLCERIKSLDNSEAWASLYEGPILTAARLGIHEVVEEIVETFPDAIWFHDKNERYIFDLAVLYRCEKVFNLIYQMSEHKYNILQGIDTFGNNILHLAGRLAPLDKLQLVSGAALQMQRELQWFKEVEKFVTPDDRDWENIDEETPAMVFTKEHKDLVIEGEKWINDTANSCSIAATLITTMVFAAAITVPGGNNGDSGLPIFSKEKSFIIFAVSDAISLFTSTTSLLMFLSFRTSRYAEGDFLSVLPKSFIIMLVTLFVSVASMIIAFSAAFYLVFGHKKVWMLFLLLALAWLPATFFVQFQFPLLVDMFISTYIRRIFGRQSQSPFYYDDQQANKVKNLHK